MKQVSIFGATGSVGLSTVDVIKSASEEFTVDTVTANSNAKELARIAIDINAKCAVVADKSAYNELKDSLSGHDIDVMAGRDALLEAAGRPCDVMMAAIVGVAGLEPIMKALEQGTNIAVANKEPLVAAGSLVMDMAVKHGAAILPVDSEHNAIFQVFESDHKQAIERIILTASGGPFRTATIEEMELATPAQAVAHPNWSMGRKISVDSATLMNKALEVIEARYLFDMPSEKIDVVIHPQSIIHSMVEYADGSILAQMGAPDMRVPIAYCLGWPERMAAPSDKLNFNQLINLTLEPIDKNKFKSVKLAYQCLDSGAAYCAAFNAANEVAVEAFLNEEIGFMDIVVVIEMTLEKIQYQTLNSIADIVLFDETVRTLSRNYIESSIRDKKVHAA